MSIKVIFENKLIENNWAKQIQNFAVPYIRWPCMSRTFFSWCTFSNQWYEEINVIITIKFKYSIFLMCQHLCIRYVGVISEIYYKIKNEFSILRMYSKTYLMMPAPLSVVFKRFLWIIECFSWRKAYGYAFLGEIKKKHYSIMLSLSGSENHILLSIVIVKIITKKVS